jgi:hypothetical protein
MGRSPLTGSGEWQDVGVFLVAKGESDPPRGFVEVDQIFRLGVENGFRDSGSEHFALEKSGVAIVRG